MMEVVGGAPVLDIPTRLAEEAGQTEKTATVSLNQWGAETLCLAFWFISVEKSTQEKLILQNLF